MSFQTRFAHSDATRHLCVGAELDPRFARAVLHELVTRYRRAVAPSYGVDVIPVVEHALRGERRRAFRDALLTAVLTAWLTLFPLPAGAALLAALLARRTWRELSGTGRAGVVALVGIGAALAGWAMMRYQGALAASPAAGLLGPLGLTRVGAFLISVPAIALAACAIPFLEWEVGRRWAGRHLDADHFRPGRVPVRLSRRMRRRLQAIDAQQWTSIVVYRSEARSPFVGAGWIVTRARWTITVDIRRRGRSFLEGERAVIPFAPCELYGRIEDRLRPLRDETGFEPHGLPDLEVSSRWYVDGLKRWKGRTAHEVLNAPAEADALIDEMRRVIDVPDGRLRYFTCLRVEAWGRELIANTFLHIATQGSTLYLELTPCLLPPIRSDYKVVDLAAVPAAAERIPAAHDALAGCIDALLGAPIRLVDLNGWASERIRERRDEREERRDQREGRERRDEPAPRASRRSSLDCGARTSVRELGSAPDVGYHFQQLDWRKYGQVLEKQMFNAITDFLEEHGVDVSEFQRQVTWIQNSGTMLVGSSVGDSAVIGRDNVGAAAQPAPGPAPAAPAVPATSGRAG
ncbi:MAG TPA: hypothetical protein VLW53_10650 [Candidatus Eisenbacteria bacterium]|nr:hypothetical protein [Candidatus Eisenbacteria bacterium]